MTCEDCGADWFQSLRGFSGCCDRDRLDMTNSNYLFQSLRGFSGCCDVKLLGRVGRTSVVSIPSRVFWVLRLEIDFQGYEGSSVSIPSRVFWVLRHTVDEVEVLTL